MDKIIAYIPVGKENAILLNRLAMTLGISSRAVKRKIQKLRDGGMVILSSADGGYFIPRNDKEGLKEVNRYIKMMEKQAMSRFSRVRSARRWREEYKQESIETCLK